MPPELPPELSRLGPKAKVKPVEKIDVETKPEPEPQPGPAPVKEEQVEKPIETMEVPDTDVKPIEMPDLTTTSLDQAVGKLEEVSQAISERNIVRAMAAVDIMLAEMGVASHFPELSEAMAKMLEAYQYANSRISTVLSGLRGSVAAVEKKEEKAEAAQPVPEVVETKEEFEKPVETAETELPAKQ
jgi:hypothetical protein